MPQKKLFELVGMAAHNITVVPNRGPEFYNQSGLSMRVTAETTGFIIIKRKTTPGKGKGGIYSTETQRVPASLRQGNFFLRGTGGEKRKATHRCQVGRSPVRQSHVCRQFLKKKKRRLLLHY